MAFNFNTLKNKEFLWKLMYETNLFEGLDNSMVGIIQTHFEKKIAEMDMKKTKEDNLISLNKQMIQEMMKDIKTNLNIPKQIINVQKKSSYSTTNNINMITAQEITKNRQEMFDIQLKTMKTEFDQMINVPKPNIIEFADKNLEMNAGNEPFDENSDIEKLLAETIAKRENMLLTINDADKSKASKWLNREEHSIIAKEMSTAQIKPLKISSENVEPIDIIENKEIENKEEDDDNNNIEMLLKSKKNKNVSFDETMNFIPIRISNDDKNNNDINEDEFHSISIKNIHSELNEIKEKLNIIMKLLEKG